LNFCEVSETKGQDFDHHLDGLGSNSPSSALGCTHIVREFSIHRYEFEMPNHYSFALYPTSEHLRDDFLNFHRWQWLQNLASQKLFELHSEVFEHFAKYPEDLQRIEWRQFEELLDTIFKNRAFIRN
jgi:hypothetical protein